MRSNFKNRYRPYYKLNKNLKYDIFYPEDYTISSSFIKNETFLQKIKIFLINYTYSANSLKTIKNIFRNSETKDIINNLDRLYSESRGYYATNRYNVDGSMYFLEKTLKDANKIENKTVIIIPTSHDIKKFYEEKLEYTHLDWYKKFKLLQNKYDVEIIDLMKYVDFENYNDYFFKCNSHWSPKGNRFAYEIYSIH